MNRPAPGHSLPLSQLLGRCANAVAAVRKGQSLNEALAATPAPERPGTQAPRAVRAYKKNPRAGQAPGGLVNAVLRRFRRERAELIASLADDEVARHNHPGWWIRRLKKDWPDHWQAIP